MSIFDKATTVVAAMVGVALIAALVHAYVTGVEYKSNIYNSNVCGEQQIVAISRPRGAAFSTVLCEDGTVRGVK